MRKKENLKIFTWNVHGTFMSALVKTGHEFYIPIKPNRPYNYDGKTPGYNWPNTVHEIKVEEIKNFKYDLIILQTPQQVLEEQNLVLSEIQKKLPKIYIVHAPFKKDPRSYLKDKEKKELMYNIKNKILPTIKTIVHITKYNLNQWSLVFPEARSKSKVIYHGIEISNILWQGNIKKAVAAVNGLPNRIECGPDIWQKINKKVPIILFGTDSEKFGGKGPVPNDELRKEFIKYRVYFNSTTASSIPMAMLEAMSVGMPVVSTATTEIPNIIKDGVNGFISNNTDILAEKINLLLKNKKLAKKLGRKAKKTIKRKFSEKKFIKEWNNLFKKVID